MGCHSCFLLGCLCCHTWPSSIACQLLWNSTAMLYSLRSTTRHLNDSIIDGCHGNALSLGFQDWNGFKTAINAFEMMTISLWHSLWKFAWKINQRVFCFQVGLSKRKKEGNRKKVMTSKFNPFLRHDDDWLIQENCKRLVGRICSVWYFTIFLRTRFI